LSSFRHITNFRAHYDLTRHLQLAVQIDNLFNLEYYTAAWLSNAVLTAQGAFQSQPFPAYVSNTPSKA
jgi:outer membrane receptor protein involved in Fe transport